MAYIGRTPTVGNFQICDAISVVNGQAAYTMQVGSVNVLPETANHMIVSLNGTIQKPNSSYTVSGSTITFASNLATGDVIDFIQILGDVLDLGVPSDATVTNAKISYPLTQSGATVSTLNRTSNDGSILELQKDNTAVGSIKARSSFTVLQVGSLGTGISGTSSHTLLPSVNNVRSDNTNDFGNASYRWKDIYLSGGAFIGGTGTANKLSDYEEGEYDITATDSGGGATITLKSYTNRLRYTKIGTTVHVQGRIQTDTVTGSYSGSLRINLPFTAADLIDTGDSVGTVLGHFATFDSGASPACWVNEGVNYLDFKVSRSGNAIGDFTLSAGTYLIFQVTYVTN